MDWVELIGKVLFFVSFFLLTPVLLRPETLKRLAEHGASGAAFLIAFVVWAVVLVVAGMMLGDWLTINAPPKVGDDAPPLRSPPKGSPPPPTTTGFDFAGYFGFQVKKVGYLLNTAFRLSLYALMLGTAAGAAYLTKQVTERYVVSPLLHRLANSPDLTHTFAKVGAWLFVVGSLLDFALWAMRRYLQAG